MKAGFKKQVMVVVLGVLGLQSQGFAQTGDDSLNCENYNFRESILYTYRYQGAVHSIEIKDSYVEGWKELEEALVGQDLKGFNSSARDFQLRVDARKLNCSGALKNLNCESLPGQQVDGQLRAKVWMTQKHTGGLHGSAELAREVKVSNLKLTVALAKADPIWPPSDQLNVEMTADIEVAGKTATGKWSTWFDLSPKPAASQHSYSWCEVL